MQNNNTALAAVVDKLDLVETAGTTTNLVAFPLQNIFPSDVGQYWRYAGSLTTPGCYESVVWTVFKNKILISEAQVVFLCDTYQLVSILLTGHIKILCLL